LTGLEDVFAGKPNVSAVGSTFSSGTLKFRAPACDATSPRALRELESEIVRLNMQARSILADRVEPLNEEFHRLLDIDGWRYGRKGSYEEAVAYSHGSGREAALDESKALFARADNVFERVMEIPATTRAARASKVRCLLVHAKPGWRGSEIDDWSDEQVRNLLAEFSGMTAEEITNV
jgi:hypothetical protein